jgi:hypothetical protein
MANGIGGTARRGMRGVCAWVGLLTLSAALLAGCGAEEAATSIPATARAAATTAATNVPPGAVATAQAAATNIPGGAVATAQAAATNLPGGAVATAQAAATGVAPTVNAAVSAPAASGPQLTVTGEVTKLDPVARTFTVRGTDGKDYDFTASANSQVDLTALATNLASKAQVTITYSGTTPPYQVVSVR